MPVVDIGPDAIDTSATGRGAPVGVASLPYHAPVPFDIEWVVLTMGDRATALDAAVSSLLTGRGVGVVVVSNGSGEVPVLDDPRVRLVVAADNLGVPGGRDFGLAHCSAPIVGFLDDDAVARQRCIGSALIGARAGRKDLAQLLVDEIERIACIHNLLIYY